jgi:hypothetical protein
MKTSVRLAVTLLMAIALTAAAGRAITLARSQPIALVHELLPPAMAHDALLLDQWFASQAGLTWAHILAGGLFLSLMPVQFSAGIRRRYVRFHRWSGRVLLIVAVPAALTGLLLQIRSPYGGMLALSATVAVAALFLACGLLAYLAIRRRDTATHRDWMIRLFAVALGAAFVRVAGLLLLIITGARPLDLLGLSFWIGFAVSVLFGEILIRSPRGHRDPEAAVSSLSSSA